MIAMAMMIYSRLWSLLYTVVFYVKNILWMRETLWWNRITSCLKMLCFVIKLIQDVMAEFLKKVPWQYTI